MAIGRTAFRDIQISNPEDTAGTAEAAVEILICKYAAAYADLVLHQPEADRNSLSRNHGDDVIVAKDLEIELEGDVNHRMIIWQLANSIRGNITPTQPDATNEPLSYLWLFSPGIFTANTPEIANGIDTFTLELGDNVQHYEAEYMFTTSLEISAEPDGVVEFSWTTKARQLTETTKTAALVEQSVQRFPSNTVEIYLDSSWATIGNTQVTDLLRSWTWTLETNFTARQTADGVLVFSGVNEDIKFVGLEMEYLRSTASELEKDKYNARTTTFVRIKCNGISEMDSGQNNLPYIQFDMSGRYMEWGDVDDDAGSQYETVMLESVYDITGAKEYEVSVLTDLASYPV
jgi:hypothetical protein